jgi:hypothetical protein
MEIIELKPKRLQIAVRVFVTAFIWHLVMMLWRHGLCDQSEIWLFLRARGVEALLVTALASCFPLRYRDIELTGTTLRAPVKKRRRGWESTTVDLNDVVVSRAFVDRVCGAQLITADDRTIDINPFYYPVGSIGRLLDEIELRQQSMGMC